MRVTFLSHCELHWTFCQWGIQIKQFKANVLLFLSHQNYILIILLQSYDCVKFHNVTFSLKQETEGEKIHKVCV